MAILDAVESSRVCCSGFYRSTDYSPLSCSDAECCCEDRAAPQARQSCWETRLGSHAALGLSILEIKRLLLLSLEMLVDSRAVRFAGALAPLLMSFCDLGLGFPVAVATLYALRRRRRRRRWQGTIEAKDRLRRRICMLCLCVTLNVVTLVLIAVHVDTDNASLARVFGMAMKFYARDASHKLAVDDLQLDLECCGFSSYSDWFGFDWQEKIGSTYYADSEDGDNDVEDEEYTAVNDEATDVQVPRVEDRGVPYSCCAKWILVPCAQSNPVDPRTLNQGGCATKLASIMLRLAVVGYLVTALVIFSQVFLVLLLCRIVNKMTEEADNTECSCWESSCPLTSSDAYLSQRQSAKSSLRRYRKANRQRLLRLARNRGGSSKLLPPSSRRRRQFFKSTTSLCTTTTLRSSDHGQSSSSSSSASSPTSSRGESTTANTDRGMMSCG